MDDRTAALREADRRKDEFLAALAHELRNPLAALRAAAEVLQLKAVAGDARRSAQGVIDRQLQQVTRLIDDLLDVSRITRDRLQLRTGRVELERAITSAVEASQPGIDQRRHSLTVTLPPHPVYLRADLVRLSQVFSNLLDNAAKYTESGGRIRLTAETDGDQVVVRVRDNGVGIDRDMLPRIFDLFMQVETSPDKVHGGLGIGLTLVRRLVELHGGTVTGTSEGRGRGAEFTVSLPVLSGPVTAEVPLEPEPQTEADPSLRVLIVEDNQDAAEMLTVMVKAWGHDTRVAYDARSALDQAGRLRPHVILLDIGLPQLHGYQVAGKLREQPWGRDALIVAVTGWGQESDRHRSRVAGIDHHLLKPVDPAALKKLLAGFKPRT